MWRGLSTLIVLIMLFALSLFIVACDDDDDNNNGTQPTPTPTTSPSPSASPSPSPSGSPSPGPEIDQNDIGGTVSGGTATGSRQSGAAGVWVIAETDQVLTNNDKPGKFRKIVVTNDQGQFVIPDLPDATYNVWVRGYGLKD